MKTLFMALGLMITSMSAQAQSYSRGYTYIWSNTIQDNTGACFKVTLDRKLLNGGYAVDNAYCEELSPSRYQWDVDFNGFGVCLKVTPNNLLLDHGRAQDNDFCETHYPSHYAWSKNFGGTYSCFQLTPARKLLNKGHAVSDELCL